MHSLLNPRSAKKQIYQSQSSQENRNHSRCFKPSVFDLENNLTKVVRELQSLTGMLRLPRIQPKQEAITLGPERQGRRHVTRIHGSTPVMEAEAITDLSRGEQEPWKRSSSCHRDSKKQREVETLSLLPSSKPLLSHQCFPWAYPRTSLLTRELAGVSPHCDSGQSSGRLKNASESKQANIWHSQYHQPH